MVGGDAESVTVYGNVVSRPHRFQPAVLALAAEKPLVRVERFLAADTAVDVSHRYP